MGQSQFQKLQRNLASYSVSDGVLRATFRCPLSGRTVDASAPIDAPAHGQGLGELWQAARRSATRMIHDLLSPAPTPSDPPQPEEIAILAAFASVQNAFHWDERRGHFVASEQADHLQNPFDLLLRQSPLSRQGDRDVAARAVWDIIRADGEIHPAEEKFVQALLGKKIAAARATPELSKLDIDQVSAACRGVVWMLAKATALSDEKRHAREQQRLARLAQWLDLKPETLETLRNAAAQKVIENVLLECYSDSVMDQAEHARVALLAERIGVNEALVAKVDVRLRQRGAHK